MKKYEYKVVPGNMQVSVEELNKEGLESWELIWVQQIGMSLHYFYKRELKNEKSKPVKK